MPDVVRAFIGSKQRERCRHQLADLVERARPRGAEERLQFGERHFDGIEVGTVGRKKAEMRPGLLDGRSHLGLLVGGEVVEHDDIAAAQRRHEDLLHVGAECGVVDRPIEDGRGRQLRGAQGRDDRVRLPMTARRVIPNPGPAGTAGVAASQISGHARFVDEDVRSRVVKRQRLSPPPSGGGDVRSTLFVGVYGFF